MSPFVRNLLILVGVTVLIIVLNQEIALLTVYVLLSLGFVIALAVAAYMVWRDFGRREIGMWPQRAQVIFYSALALFIVDMGVWFLGHPSGRDALGLILVAAGSVYAGYRTWREQNRLS